MSQTNQNDATLRFEEIGEVSYMLWPDKRRVSHDVVVVWAMDAIDNGACQMNPVPTLAQLQCNPKLARDVVEQAGYATFRAVLRVAS